MASDPHLILAKLDSEKKFLRRRAWLAWLINAIIIICLPLLILAVVDKLWPIKEHTSFLFCLAGITGTVFFVIQRFFCFSPTTARWKKSRLDIGKSLSGFDGFCDMFNGIVRAEIP